MAVLDPEAVFCLPLEAGVRLKSVLEGAYCRLRVAQVRVEEAQGAFCLRRAYQVSLYYIVSRDQAL